MKKLFIKLLNTYKSFRKWRLGLSGKTLEDHHKERVVSGKAWEEFCDTLKSAGTAMVYQGAPTDPFNQAEGYRYLTRLTRVALENFVEFADPTTPKLRRLVHETVKIGADNPDNYYQNSKISGEYEYRIFGTRGTVKYLSFGTQKGDYGKTGNMEPSGLLEASELEIESDGSFEIFLSREQKGKNWLKMEPETSLVMVRQTFLDRDTEELAYVQIERLDEKAEPKPITPQLVDEGLTTAGAFVAGCALFFTNWSKGFQKHTNELPLFDPEKSTKAGGDPNIDYYHSYWKIGDDEALVIDFTPPECEHWNFQLNNHWMESLDYQHFSVHTNKHLANYRADGSVRLIVSHVDPEKDNWINTVGHSQGTMLLRWVKARERIQPSIKLMKFSEL
ncbi:MAG: DUF1214 domain-containing protein [Bacteroidota bacterium]